LIFSKILNLFFDGIFINWKFTNYRKDKIEIEVKNSLAAFIPEVQVLGTKMSEPGSDAYNREIDMNKAGIIVYYSIIGTPIQDSVSITTTV